jgi:hypothetical protein
MRREKAGISMKKQMFRERECIHRDDDVAGEFYNGAFYIQALQRLPVSRAMEVASRVGSFFWSDAEHMLVWLCSECAAELSLLDTPRALTQPVRRQA